MRLTDWIDPVPAGERWRLADAAIAASEPPPIRIERLPDPPPRRSGIPPSRWVVHHIQLRDARKGWRILAAVQLTACREARAITIKTNDGALCCNVSADNLRRAAELANEALDAHLDRLFEAKVPS